MLGKLVLPEIRELIESGDDGTLRDVVNRWHPADLGHVVTQLNPAEQVRVLRLLEPRIAAETFEYLDLETQLAVLGSISEQARRIGQALNLGVMGNLRNLFDSTVTLIIPD